MGEQVSSSSQIANCNNSSRLLPCSWAGYAVAVLDRVAHRSTTRSNRIVNWHEVAGTHGGKAVDGAGCDSQASGGRRPGECWRPPFSPSGRLRSWPLPGAGRTGTSCSSAFEPVREDRRGLARRKSLVNSGELELKWVVAEG